MHIGNFLVKYLQYAFMHMGANCVGKTNTIDGRIILGSEQIPTLSLLKGLANGFPRVGHS